VASTPTIPQLTAGPGYCPQAADTSIETDLLTFYLLQQRSPVQRLQMADALIRDARRMSLCGLHHHFSHLSTVEFARKVALAWLQEACPADYIPLGDEMTWIQDSSTLAAQLHQIFTALNIRYYITGGVAAIVYGEPRTTRDVDVVLELAIADLDRLTTALEANGFYVPGVDDVKSGRMQTLGITHIESIARADLVISKNQPWEQLKFQRRQPIEMSDAGQLYFASPEDLILNKLRWRQQSGSQKQWRDVLGILKVQGNTLDRDYLEFWATQFGTIEALQQAFVAADWSVT
jgi:hypothetical protein